MKKVDARRKITVQQRHQLVQVYLHLGSKAANELCVEFGVAPNYARREASDLGYTTGRGRYARLSKHCQFCGEVFLRRDTSDLERLYRFNARKFCSLECGRKARTGADRRGACHVHPIMEHLRKVRIASRVSQFDLANASGYNRSQVVRYEQGFVKAHELWTVSNWAEFLGYEIVLRKKEPLAEAAE